MLLSPLHAQQNQRPPLQGGITDEVINPDFRRPLDILYRIDQLAGSIVGLVSLIGADLHNHGTSASVHQTMDGEIAELEKYKRSGKYGRIAEQYNPCIQMALSAEPHIIKAWEAEKEAYRLRITGTASRLKALRDLTTREDRIAWDLQRAATECVGNIEAKQPWNNPPGGQPPGGNNNPNSPSNPPRRGGTRDSGQTAMSPLHRARAFGFWMNHAGRVLHKFSTVASLAMRRCSITPPM